MNLHQLLHKTYETHFQAWCRNHSYALIAENVVSQPSRKKKWVTRDVQSAIGALLSATSCLVQSNLYILLGAHSQTEKDAGKDLIAENWKEGKRP